MKLQVAVTSVKGKQENICGTVQYLFSNEVMRYHGLWNQGNFKLSACPVMG